MIKHNYKKRLELKRKCIHTLNIHTYKYIPVWFFLNQSFSTETLNRIASAKFKLCSILRIYLGIYHYRIYKVRRYDIYFKLKIFLMYDTKDSKLVFKLKNLCYD